MALVFHFSVNVLQAWGDRGEKWLPFGLNKPGVANGTWPPSIHPLKFILFFLMFLAFIWCFLRFLLYHTFWMCFPGSRTTRTDTPATSRRPTACVRAAWSGHTEGRASSTAAPQSSLPPSSCGERAPVLADATPTPRSTSPWPWGAPACRWWRRSETARAATRAWREESPKPDRCSLLARSHKGDGGGDMTFDTWTDSFS